MGALKSTRQPRYQSAPGAIQSRQRRLAARPVGVVQLCRQGANAPGRPCGHWHPIATGSPSSSAWRNPIPATRAGETCRWRTAMSAGCRWREGDLAGALTSYREVLAIIGRLAQSDPGNADWQRDLSVSYDNVGDVRMAQGDLPGALKSYRDSLAIKSAPGAIQSRQRRLAAQSIGFVQQGRRRLDGARPPTCAGSPTVTVSPSLSAWRNPIGNADLAARSVLVIPPHRQGAVGAGRPRGGASCNPIATASRSESAWPDQSRQRRTGSLICRCRTTMSATSERRRPTLRER